jgi:hypothetical protein
MVTRFKYDREWPHNFLTEVYGITTEYENLGTNVDQLLQNLLEIADRYNSKCSMVIRCHYKYKQSFFNIGKSIGLSRSRIAQINNGAISFLKNYIKVENVQSDSIEHLHLTVRVFNCLMRKNIKSIQDLLQLNYADLLSIRNMGKAGIAEIISKLEALGYYCDHMKSSKNRKNIQFIEHRCKCPCCGHMFVENIAIR